MGQTLEAPTRLITEFADGSYLEFRTGNKDDYCIFAVSGDGRAKAPLDTEYFASLLGLAQRRHARQQERNAAPEDLGDRRGYHNTYDDFVEIYNHCHETFSPELRRVIDGVSLRYEEDAPVAVKTFCLLAAGMVAENLWPPTKVGKRVKRLGVHTILIEQRDIPYAANFMKGMGWREISALCDARGF